MFHDKAGNFSHDDFIVNIIKPDFKQVINYSDNNLLVHWMRESAN